MNGCSVRLAAVFLHLAGVARASEMRTLALGAADQVLDLVESTSPGDDIEWRTQCAVMCGRHQAVGMAVARLRPAREHVRTGVAL